MYHTAQNLQQIPFYAGEASKNVPCAYSGSSAGVFKFTVVTAFKQFVTVFHYLVMCWVFGASGTFSYLYSSHPDDGS